MTRPRVLAGIIATAFCLMLTASVRADNNHGDLLLEKLIFAERHNLSEIGNPLIDTNYLYTAHFEDNHGKHLGFSMAAVAHQGPTTEIVKSPPSASSVTQNPEPTAMVLLGTGLAAAAAMARKLNRKRRH